MQEAGTLTDAGARLPEPSLKTRLRRAERMKRLKAIALVAPLFLFVLGMFATPITAMLARAIDNPEVIAAMPRTASELKSWDGAGTPPVEAYAALAADLRAGARDRSISEAAKRLNYEVSGMRSLVMSAARKIGPTEAAAPEDERRRLIEADARWNEPSTWAAIKRSARATTPYYLLAALDLREADDGSIVSAPPEEAVYRAILLRTIVMAGVVTLACIALGFPAAYMLANARGVTANVLMIMVLLPFWTSLLVRTSAWVVLLQKEGLINSLLGNIGLIDQPLELLFNRVGVYVAMTHILLPFMILPLYSVMKSIPPAYMRAAESLGAAPAEAFLRVYLPQALPGLGAGGLLVFILAIGYYITPALVGGPKDQMLSYFIAFYTNQTINWGMAAALGVILLAVTLVLYAVYQRLVGGSSVKMG